jgi:hypothetical protein
MSTTTVEEKVTETEAKKEEVEEVAAVTEAKTEEVAVAVVVEEGEEDEGECDCEECQGGATGGATGGWAEYEEEGGWIDELGVDEHDFY